MDKYRAFLSVKLELEAESEDEVERILINMDYEFTDPKKADINSEIKSEIINWEISKVY